MDLVYYRNSIDAKFFPALWTILSSSPKYISIQYNRNISQVILADMSFRKLVI
jgi:hypothetical protein